MMYVIHIMNQEKRTMTNETSEIRKCRLCGVDFKPRRFWQKFCTREHQREYWKRIQQDRYELNRRLEEIEKKLGL